MRIHRFTLMPLLVVVAFFVTKPVRADTTQTVLSYCRPVAQAKAVGHAVQLKMNFESGFC
jgi:hypothetical protein